MQFLWAGVEVSCFTICRWAVFLSMSSVLSVASSNKHEIYLRRCETAAWMRIDVSQCSLWSVWSSTKNQWWIWVQMDLKCKVLSERSLFLTFRLYLLPIDRILFKYLQDGESGKGWYKSVGHKLSEFEFFISTGSVAPAPINVSTPQVKVWLQCSWFEYWGPHTTVYIRGYRRRAGTFASFTRPYQVILVVTIFTIASLATRASGTGRLVSNSTCKSLCGAVWWCWHLFCHSLFPTEFYFDRADYALLYKSSDSNSCTQVTNSLFNWTIPNRFRLWTKIKALVENHCSAPNKRASPLSRFLQTRKRKSLFFRELHNSLWPRHYTLSPRPDFWTCFSFSLVAELKAQFPFHLNLRSRFFATL